MRPEKQQLVQDLRGFLDAKRGVFLIAYKGLSVAQMAELRTQLAENEAECHVIPNRLLRRAASEEPGCAALADVPLTGETALVTGGSDAVQVAKKVAAFARANPACAFKCGLLEGKLLGPDEVKIVTTLPGREVLLAQLLGVLQGPLRQLVGVLNAEVASIVYAIQAYLDKKEETESAS